MSVATIMNTTFSFGHNRFITKTSLELTALLFGEDTRLMDNLQYSGQNVRPDR